MFADISDKCVESYFADLPEDLHGEWKKSQDEMFPSLNKEPRSLKKRKGLKKAMDKLVVGEGKDAKTIMTTLSSIGKCYKAVEQNSHCVYAAYLGNLNVPAGYDVLKFRRQIAAFAVKNCKFFRE